MDAFKNIKTGSKPLKAISVFSQLSLKAKELYEKIKKEKNDIDAKRLVYATTDGTNIFNFNTCNISLDLASGIFRKKTSLKDAEDKQLEMTTLLKKLKRYNPDKPIKK